MYIIVRFILYGLYVRLVGVFIHYRTICFNFDYNSYCSDSLGWRYTRYTRLYRFSRIPKKKKNPYILRENLIKRASRKTHIVFWLLTNTGTGEIWTNISLGWATGDFSILHFFFFFSPEPESVENTSPFIHDKHDYTLRYWNTYRLKNVIRPPVQLVLTAVFNQSNRFRLHAS